jgi:hypothetical protein
MKNITVNDSEFKQVLSHFNFDFSKATISSLGNGHINSTYKLTTPEYEFVLQRINHEIFSNPVKLSENAQQINKYLLEQRNKGQYPLMVAQQIQSKS